MELRAAVFDDKGNFLKEIKGEMLSVMGVTLHPITYGAIATNVSSIHVGKIAPEILPDIMSANINKFFEDLKSKKEYSGKDMDKIRMELAFKIASGGEKL